LGLLLNDCFLGTRVLRDCDELLFRGDDKKGRHGFLGETINNRFTELVVELGDRKGFLGFDERSLVSCVCVTLFIYSYSTYLHRYLWEGLFSVHSYSDMCVGVCAILQYIMSD